MFSVLNYLREQFNWQICWHVPIVLVITILVLFTASGCDTRSTQFYENSQLGITFKYPKNWNLETSKRVNNSIVLQSNKGFFKKDSTRIEILVGIPTNTFIDLEDGLEKRINNIGSLYKTSVTIIQPPNRIKRGDYEIITATISIPTTSIPEKSPINQVNRRKSKVLQIIDLYTIRNSDNRDFDISIYRGNNYELNKQAEEIINSIKFIPTSTP